MAGTAAWVAVACAPPAGLEVMFQKGSSSGMTLLRDGNPPILIQLCLDHLLAAFVAGTMLIERINALVDPVHAEADVVVHSDPATAFRASQVQHLLIRVSPRVVAALF